MIRILKLIILLQVVCNFCFGTEKDSIFYNKSKPEKDRIILFDKKYFVRVYIDVLKNDTTINIVYGKYHVMKDTVFFMPPDSADKPNEYFCFCKTKYDTKKMFHLYNKKNNSYPPDGIEPIYKKLFKTKPPNYTQITLSSSFKGLKKSKYLEVFKSKDVYVLLE